VSLVRNSVVPFEIAEEEDHRVPDVSVSIQKDPPTTIARRREDLLAVHPLTLCNVERRSRTGKIQSATGVARAAVLERRSGQQRVVELELVRYT
jgi:hypothetical protein